MTADLADTVLAVINYGTPEDTLACVELLREQAPDARVLVVDNGSATLKSADFDQLSDVDFLGLDRNLGYAGAVNVAIREAALAGRGWLAVVNPDARPEPDALRTVLAHASPRVGVLTAAQVQPDSSGALVPYVCAASGRGVRPRPVRCTGCDVGQHAVDYVTGALLVVNVATACTYQGMDERYFHYKEEFDFCHRVGLTGAITFVCSARVVHARGGTLAASSPLAAYYWARNEILFVRKFGRRDIRNVMRVGLVVVETLRRVQRSAHGSRLGAVARVLSASLVGLAHGLAGIDGRFVGRVAG